ncbi:MAG: VanZ family protein [Clostridia bacterium]|nr:VanZ family protein [Clostridia bacterium]
MKRKHFWWILVAAWCIFIFFKSNTPADISAAESSTITMALNRFFDMLFGPGRIVVSDNLVRKTAHFIEYCILGFIIFKAYFNKEKLLQTFWFSTIFAVLYAISDEIHQYFVPGRAMRATDVLIDSAGILLATLLLYSREARYQKAG